MANNGLRLPKTLTAQFDNSPAAKMMAGLDGVVRTVNWPTDLPAVLANCIPRKRALGWIRAGDLYQPCDRMMAAALIKQPPHEFFEPGTLRIFENGSFSHLRMYMWWLHYPDPWQALAPIQLKKWPVQGEQDGSLEHPDIGRWALEFKTINNLAFGQLNGPTEEHRLQLNTYLGLSGGQQGMVWYENKNNQRHRLFEIAFDPVEFSRAMGRATGIAQGVGRQELPGMCDTCPEESFCRSLKVSPRVANVCRRAGRVAR